MKKYNFIKDIIGKKINVTLTGQFNAQEGMEFVQEFKKQVSTTQRINEYVLSIDCTGIIITGSDAIESLEHCFEMYKQAGFKSVEFITSKNKSKTFLEMQYSRLGKKVGLNLKFI